MKLLTVTLAAFCFFATTNLQAQPYADELLDRIKNRGAVLSSFEDDLVLQYSIPPQYPMCLYAASMEAGFKNNVAHDFILKQIDFLYKTGLSASNISSLISYGHAILNFEYSVKNNKRFDRLTPDDFSLIQKYSQEVFIKFSCFERFEDDRLKAEMESLIRNIVSKKDK